METYNCSYGPNSGCSYEKPRKKMQGPGCTCFKITACKGTCLGWV